MNPVSLIGADILGYAKAWESEHAKGIALDDILRCWRGVPTRIQMRNQRKAEREAAKLRTAQEMAARSMGMA